MLAKRLKRSRRLRCILQIRNTQKIRQPYSREWVARSRWKKSARSVEQCSLDRQQNTRVSVGVARLRTDPSEEFDACYDRGIPAHFFRKSFWMARFFNPKSAETGHIYFDIFCCIARLWDYFSRQQLWFFYPIIFLGEVQSSQARWGRV